MNYRFYFIGLFFGWMCLFAHTIYAQKKHPAQMVNAIILNGNYALCKESYDNIANSLEDLETDKSWATASMHIMLGRLATRLSNFSKAESHYTMAMKLTQGDDEDNKFLHCIAAIENNAINLVIGENKKWHDNYIAVLQELTNDTYTKVDHVKQAQRKTGRTFTPEYQEWKKILSNNQVKMLGLAADLEWLILGRYNQAAEKYMEALDYYDKYRADNPRIQIELLLKTVDALLNAGRYEETNIWLNVIESVIIEKCGKNKFYHALWHERVARFFYNIGDMETAKTILDKAILMMEHNGEQATIEYANMLLQQGKVLVDVDPKEAFAYLDKACKSFANMFSLNHLSVIRGLIYMTDALTNDKQFTKASRMWDLSAKYGKATLSGSLLDYLNWVRSGVDIYIEEKNHVTALKSIDELSKIVTEMVELTGASSTVMPSLYSSIGFASFEAGKIQDAFSFLTNQIEIEKTLVHDTFAFLGESYREKYWKQCSKRMNRLFLLNRLGSSQCSSATASAYEKQCAELLYNASLLNKGIMLESSASLLRIVNESQNKKLKQLFDEYSNLRQEMAHQSENLGAKISSEEQEAKQNRLSKLEEVLISQSREFEDYMNFTSITWKDVKNALQQGEAAIEFVCSSDDNGEYYSAEVISAEAPEPIHLFLTHLPKGERLVNENSELSTHLSEVIWKKIMPYLHPGKRVYFSPSGLLYNLPIEYCPLNQHQSMNEVYSMVRLSSTRELALHRSVNQQPIAVLYGGLNYNTSVEDMELYAADFQSGTDGMFRGYHAPKGTQRSLWGFLNGTLKEVDDIEKELIKGAFTVQKYTNEQGIEESVKALSNQQLGILHIATHGFYLPKEAKTQTALLYDVMLRSGLIFSGGNNAWINPDYRPTYMDDGVLTAHEISLLNLSGTNIVTLSACQTGLGDISNEGVFGLQRAFKLAGVKTLLMSLWSVNDEATRILMTEFYRLIMAGEDKHAALRKAQNKVKKSTFVIDGKQVSGNDPKLWAAFVMMD